MIRKLKGFVVKQYDVGFWFGGLKQVHSRAMSYQAILASFLALLTAYNTMMLREELGYITQWFNFPLFVGIMILFQLLAMVFVYKIEIPSTTKFNNLQAYKHRNLIRKLIEEKEKKNQKQLALILKKLEELEKRGGGTRNETV